LKLNAAQIGHRIAARNRTARHRARDPVKSVEELARLAEQKRSVYCWNCWGLLPAAVVMNMAASQVYFAISRGMVLRYVPGGAK
jgi:hypothetical protein